MSVRALRGRRRTAPPRWTERARRRSSAGRRSFVSFASTLALLTPASAQPARPSDAPSDDATPVEILLERDGTFVDPERDALSVTRRVPNDDSLPRDADAPRADDPEAFRVVVRGLDSDPPRLARLRRVEPTTGVVLDALELPLRRDREQSRSAFVRLVADPRDATAPGVAARLLRVALGDLVEVELAGRARRWRVGRPGNEVGPRAHRRATLRVHVVRWRGVPAVGGDDDGARAVMRDQLTLANAVFAPCHVDLGLASDVDVRVIDAPPPTMLSIADEDGLPALGGEVRLRADGRTIGPVTIPSGSLPAATAERVALALRRARFEARVIVEAPTRHGAGPSASVIVRGPDGAFVTLGPDGTHPLTTDRRQTIRLGVVDLDDGLHPFEDAVARAGTLEERALLHATIDDDPRTIDVVVVPWFSRPERQGEAFIASDRGPLRNVVVIDRRGLARARSAYTLPHELAHVLLDLPFHPDELGEADPTRLMSARAANATVLGPKRLTTQECVRLRERGERNGLLRAPVDIETRVEYHGPHGGDATRLPRARGARTGRRRSRLVR